MEELEKCVVCGGIFVLFRSYALVPRRVGNANPS